MGLFKETLSGFSWIGSLRVFTRLISLVKITILARILTPEEFGLFGLATLVLAFLEIITETGINVFLIQEKADLRKYLNAAWIVSIFRGLVISLVIFLAAPLIAVFFRSPESETVVRLISLVPLLRGFINPAVIKFQKELQFSREFAYKLLIFGVDAAFTIGLTLVLRSAEGLVWGLIAGGTSEVIFSHLLVKPRPGLGFNQSKLFQIVNQGKWLTLAGVFNYLFENIDDAAVARLLDISSLGLYQNAYKISSLPLSEVAEVVKRVTFPVYVKISPDRLRLQRAFLKSLTVTALIVIPCGLLFFLFPEVVVKVVLGEKWLAAVPILKVMSFLGVIRALIACSYPVFLSLKMQRIVSFSTLAAFLGLVLTLIPLTSRLGVIGVAISATIGSFFEIPVIGYYLAKVFK